MNAAVLKTILSLVTFCGVAARISAVGWLLMLVFALPNIIFIAIRLYTHKLVALKSPLNGTGLAFVFASHLFYLVAMLLQVDFGDVGGAYSGLTRIACGFASRSGDAHCMMGYTDPLAIKLMIFSSVAWILSEITLIVYYRKCLRKK